MSDFVRLCSNSEYFRLNPGKVAGVEKKTTSLAFPYTIEGTREDVERMFSWLNKGNTNELSIIELEAQAELELLELLSLNGLADKEKVFTITKKTRDGKKTFSFSYKYSPEYKEWFIIEDECGVGRNKEGTIKTIKDMLSELVKEYEFDN